MSDFGKKDPIVKVTSKNSSSLLTENSPISRNQDKSLGEKQISNERDMQSQLNQYEKLRISFQKQGISFQLTRALKRISYQYIQDNPNLSSLPLLKQMISITNQLMLNELEVAYWQMINREIRILRLQNQYFLQRLMMTALQAKKITTTDQEFEIFCAFLNHNYPKLMQNYLQWQQTLAIDFCTEISLVEVNEEFRHLYSEIGIDSNLHIVDEEEDLNFIVDSLEDEHIRRAVHTTKTIEWIDENFEEELIQKHSKMQQSDQNSRGNLRQRSRSRSNSRIDDAQRQQQGKRSRSQSQNEKQKHYEKPQDDDRNKHSHPNRMKKDMNKRHEQQQSSQSPNNESPVTLSIPFSAINNFQINNSQILLNQHFQPRQKFSQEMFYEHSQTKSNKTDAMPTFNPQIQSAESFGNGSLQYKSGSTINDLLMKKALEQQSIITPLAFADSRKSQGSITGATFGSECNTKQQYIQQPTPTSFGAQVIGFMQPFKGGQLSMQGSLSKPTSSTPIGNIFGTPINFNMNLFGQLPEFTDRGSFPSFFPNNKSGSFEISPNTSFQNYSKSQNRDQGSIVNTISNTNNNASSSNKVNNNYK